MMHPLSFLTAVADSAGRSLLLAAAVGGGLTLLRTRNVPARKAAWMLVLAASFAMPLLARWAARASWIPENAAFIVSSTGWHSNTPAPSAAAEDVVSRGDSVAAVPVPQFVARRSTAAAEGIAHFPSPAIAHNVSDVPAEAVPSPRDLGLSFGSALLIVYLAVCVALFLRIAYGLLAAAQLWFTARPVDQDIFAASGRVRCSSRIASPVTVGSGIVLPACYRSWDAEKLRIVLAHEASHVRQGDFYLQLGASIYAAIFWFSPLGWWLINILSDLAETISDRAAVEHAASHASYAQILLEFAALPRPVPTGVAMAHHGRIVSRIERLLNESSFRQSFAGGRGRIVATILLVFAAAFGSTALVRVQAAGQQAPPATVAPASPDPTAVPAPAPPSDVATPTPAGAPSDAALPALAPVDGQADAAPENGASPQAPPPPPSHPGVPDALAPLPGPGPYPLVIPKVKILKGQMRALAMLDMQKARLMALDGKNFMRFGFGNDGNTYAYVTGPGEKGIHFSGNWYDGSKAEIEKARTMAHGDFLWFERDGKSYVIDDQALLAPLKPMQDKMDTLGEQQEALGKQQEELGKQQEALGKQMEQLKVPTPDMKKELEKLKAVEEKLAAIQGKNASHEELADLQGELAEVQEQIGDLQGNMGGQMGELGGKMGELGGQQGKLGSRQGRLGAEQGRIAREMDGKILTIIDGSLKNGTARQVK